jgi:hypothetical protein
MCEFARAHLHFIKQPHVLDCNYRLVGEGDQKLDLSLKGRTDRRTSPKTPIGVPLRISGTPNIVRNPVACCACDSSYSGSLAASSIAQSDLPGLAIGGIIWMTSGYRWHSVKIT